MAIVGEQENFGRRIAEVLGLDAGMVVGIDIRVEPGNLVTATARVFLKEKQVKGLGIIFDEMKFVGIKKPEPKATPGIPAEYIQKGQSKRQWFPWLDRKLSGEPT